MKHPKKLSLRILSLLLCLMLAISGCSSKPDSGKTAQTTTAAETSAATAETSSSEQAADVIPAVIDVPDEVIPEHSDLNYEDMVYVRPDLDAIYAMFDDALQLVSQTGSQETLFSQYDSLLKQFSEVSTMSTLASLQYEMDLSNSYYEEESNLLDNELTKMDNRMNELTEAILQSEYADAFTNVYGEDFVARYEKFSKLNSPEIEALCEQETQLISEYKKLLSKEYSTIYKGKEVTLDTLDWSDENVATPYYAIYEQKNAECGEIYRQLVQIRVQIAKTLGYDSYTDYAYDCLDRDFTKEDSAQFCEMVKEYIVPVYQALENEYYYTMQSSYYSNDVFIEDGFDYLETALSAEFPAAMTEALNYMLDHNLYILDDDANMMTAGFTTLINSYGAPYLFINTSVYTDPSTLFHEFGHYYNFYLMGETGWNDSNNLDLAEVHSQGMEVLMMEYYPEIYGDNAEGMEIYVLYNLLYSIVMGACEDEFQQAVFENPDMSLAEMNMLHCQLFEEYMGYSAYYYEWVEIHHHFETPFYYISYATSAASTFELWEMEELSRDAALAAYRSITQNTLNTGYLEPLARAGLRDPFHSDMLKDVADMISERFLSN